MQEFQNLIRFLQEEFEQWQEKLLMLKGGVTYDLLWCIFPEGSEIVFAEEKSQLNCAGQVTP
jgi:hypothetical protein